MKMTKEERDEYNLYIYQHPITGEKYGWDDHEGHGESLTLPAHEISINGYFIPCLGGESGDGAYPCVIVFYEKAGGYTKVVGTFQISDGCFFEARLLAHMILDRHYRGERSLLCKIDVENGSVCSDYTPHKNPLPNPYLTPTQKNANPLPSGGYEHSEHNEKDIGRPERNFKV